MTPICVFFSVDEILNLSPPSWWCLYRNRLTQSPMSMDNQCYGIESPINAEASTALNLVSAHKCLVLTCAGIVPRGDVLGY